MIIVSLYGAIECVHGLSMNSTVVPGVVRQPAKKVGKFWDVDGFSVLNATARLRLIPHDPYDLPRHHTVCGGSSGAIAVHNWSSHGQNQAEILNFPLCRRGSSIIGNHGKTNDFPNFAFMAGSR